MFRLKLTIPPGKKGKNLPNISVFFSFKILVLKQLPTL